MEPVEKITITERDDLGPVLARADHHLNVIEVNAAFFYKLPPMVQEFVLCHEVCHLKYEEWDEERTNQLAAQLFVDRACDTSDRENRERFLSYLSRSGISNITLEAILGIGLSAYELGTGIYDLIKYRNSGWYSWDNATKKSNLKLMLTNAFESSRKTSSYNAAQIFWETFSQFDKKDDSLNEFLGRSDNLWVNKVIASYEKKYGFGFYEVTPIDWLAFTAVKVAIVVLFGLAVYLIIKKKRH